MPVTDQTSGMTYATLSAAISGSAANDVLLVPAGRYVENFPDISHSLTITSVGGRASLSNPQPRPPNGRAILNVPGGHNASLTVDGVELSGANNDPGVADPGGTSNGAGILLESGNGTLRVNNCWIHDNQNGVLAGNADAASTDGMRVLITRSEIDNNGLRQTGPQYGHDHNVYVGTVTRLDISGSYIHGALGGHEIKSRAVQTTIIGNSIQDDPTAPTSYSIDLPNGGDALIAGNVIRKSAVSLNTSIVHFGSEGHHQNNALKISSNTFINDSGLLTVALRDQMQNAYAMTVPVNISGNTFHGLSPSLISVNGFARANANGAGNTFLPALPSATHAFSGYPIPEPAGAIMLPVALLASLLMRRIRRG